MTSNDDTEAGSSSAALRLRLPKTPERRKFLREPDEALAAAAKDGDLDASAELERRYHSYVVDQVSATGYTPPELLADEVFAPPARLRGARLPEFRARGWRSHAATAARARRAGLVEADCPGGKSGSRRGGKGRLIFKERAAAIG